MKHINRLIISRTDSIGDVMLTLPMCAWIKKHLPQVTIIFLGKAYTQSIVESYAHVDEFVDWDKIRVLESSEQRKCFKALKADAIIHVFPNKIIGKLAKHAKVGIRIGTSHRLHHLLTCNERVNFTRKGSDLHEAQLNHELLRPLGLTELPSLEEIEAHTSAFKAKELELPSNLTKALQESNKCVILHPKSQGSAKEWPMEKYIELAEQLARSEYAVIFTGTEKEGALFREELPVNPHIIDSTGSLSLDQLIRLISQVDYLVACSTGPLHIAGYLGIGAIGLYSPKRPIHPGRWKALGEKVQVVVNDPNCEKCAQKEDCNCVSDIAVERIVEIIQ